MPPSAAAIPADSLRMPAVPLGGPEPPELRVERAATTAALTAARGCCAELEARVGTRIREAVGTLASSLEDRLAEARRRQAEEMSIRLAGVERELGRVRYRLGCLEAAAGPPVPTLRRGCGDESSAGAHAGAADLGAVVAARPATAGVPAADVECRILSWMEDRIGRLESRADQPAQSMPLEVARQLQVMRGQLLDESVSRCQVAVERARADSDGLRLRLDSLERWLQDVIAPEVVRAQLDLASQRQEYQRAITDFSVQVLAGGESPSGTHEAHAPATFSYSSLSNASASTAASALKAHRSPPGSGGESKGKPAGKESLDSTALSFRRPRSPALASARQQLRERLDNFSKLP